MDKTPPTETVSPPRKKNKRRGWSLLLALLLFLIAIGLWGWTEYQRRQVAQKLEQTEAKLQELSQSTQHQGEQVAQQVLTRVRRHIDLPEDPQPTVATLVDVERLQENNAFYEQAENGDHLIITETRAILYDPDQDRLLDVVPVSIESGEPQPTPETTPTADPSPTPEETTDPAESP